MKQCEASRHASDMHTKGCLHHPTVRVCEAAKEARLTILEIKQLILYHHNVLEHRGAK
jgi:hypothetical protein